MGGTITVTEHQQWALTIALELEQDGWIQAAHFLRQKHFPGLPWKEIKKVPTHVDWEVLFRIHHGSNPALPGGQGPSLLGKQGPSLPGHACSQPVIGKPEIRKDQITS